VTLRSDSQGLPKEERGGIFVQRRESEKKGNITTIIIKSRKNSTTLFEVRGRGGVLSYHSLNRVGQAS